MPQELPGFYYDAEKNRYFPLKGPIPGSSRASSSSSSSSYAADRKNPKQNTSQADKYCRTRVKTHRLLQGRELNGNVVSVSKSKYNFVQEYQKAQASQPVVWRYQEPGELACDGGLDQTSFCIQKPDGQVNMDILVAGGINGCLREMSFYVDCEMGQSCQLILVRNKVILIKLYDHRLTNRGAVQVERTVIYVFGVSSLGYWRQQQHRPVTVNPSKNVHLVCHGVVELHDEVLLAGKGWPSDAPLLHFALFWTSLVSLLKAQYATVERVLGF
ncbi:unnamed protein product [Linum tenue]|uniref:Uncharacterized protein n=1 Tax=Linum tenue TaxID=586396 RepID=A0AAV0QMA7_9ROSI|nr:unnamed protein product [Linum tenue]